MTRHWMESVDERCAGCAYLRKYGLPETFIRTDHENEMMALLIGPTIAKPRTYRDGHQKNPGKDKTRMHCNECGRGFSRKIGSRTVEVKCPKCGGFDTEVA